MYGCRIFYNIDYECTPGCLSANYTTNHTPCDLIGGLEFVREKGEYEINESNEIIIEADSESEAEEYCKNIMSLSSDGDWRCSCSAPEIFK